MKEIYLTNSTRVALVDDNDYAELVNYTWRLNNYGYVVRTAPRPKGGPVLMHRQIIQAPKGVQVDHINTCKIDNRRSNLRLANNAQNHHNIGIVSNNTSGVKGVYWHKRAQKWAAQIVINGVNIYLGLFVDLEEARTARNAASVKYHGKFARLS